MTPSVRPHTACFVIRFGFPVDLYLVIIFSFGSALLTLYKA